MPVSVFRLFLVSEKVYTKYTRIELIIYEEFLFTERLPEPEGQSKVGPRDTRWVPGAAYPPPAPGGHPMSSGTASRRLFSHRYPLDLKLMHTGGFFQKRV